jgi:hypothetical protein
MELKLLEELLKLIMLNNIKFQKNILKMMIMKKKFINLVDLMVKDGESLEY